METGDFYGKNTPCCEARDGLPHAHPLDNEAALLFAKGLRNVLG